MTSIPLASRTPSPRALRIFLFLALVAWAMAVGKDVSWDLVNHQLYLPFAWATGRLETDLFGAGPQAYQNPLGYFPLYFMVRAGMSAWAIGLVLASFHALVVWPLDRIARLFWPGESGPDFWLRLLALAFCCVAPIFLINEGTTSNDPTASLMIVWAVALTLESGAQPGRGLAGWRGAAVAGALVGFACAIKLSNAAFALALCGLWVVKWASGQADWRRVVAFHTGLVVWFAAGAGWWMAWLWHEFGNPVYPLYNNVFHSPYAPPQAMAAFRFIPSAPLGIVTRLWELAQYSSFVAFEEFLPDLRPLATAIAALLAALVLGVQGRWRLIASRATWASHGAQMAVLMVLTYLLWIRTSGNARYAIAWFLLLGIPLVRATQRALPFSAAKILLLTLLVLQCGNYYVLGAHRFVPAAWDNGPYLPYRVSKRLQEQPFLHLSVGTQSYGSLALSFAPQGALSNPIGAFAIPTDGPLGERLTALMNQWHGRTRLLFNALDTTDPASLQHVRSGVRELLYRIGLDVDWNDCEIIGVPIVLLNKPAGSEAGAARPEKERAIFSCGVIYRHDRDEAADAQRVVARKVFAILEAACPRMFTPVPFAEERGAGVWQRHYLSTEEEVTVSVTEGVSANHFRTMHTMNYGSIEDVLARKRPIQCPEIDYQTPQ